MRRSAYKEEDVKENLKRIKNKDQLHDKKTYTFSLFKTRWIIRKKSRLKIRTHFFQNSGAKIQLTHFQLRNDSTTLDSCANQQF